MRAGRATDPPPPLCQVRGSEEGCGRRWGSLRVETPKGSPDKHALWGREGDAGRADLPLGHKGRRVCFFGGTGRGERSGGDGPSGGGGREEWGRRTQWRRRERRGVQGPHRMYFSLFHSFVFLLVRLSFLWGKWGAGEKEPHCDGREPRGPGGFVEGCRSGTGLDSCWKTVVKPSVAMIQ